MTLGRLRIVGRETGVGDPQNLWLRTGAKTDA